MKQISAIIERASDGTYSVYCKNEIFSGMGDTIEEAKADMLQQMEIYKATAKEEGFKYPEFLDGEFTITYTIDALSLMEFYLSKGWFRSRLLKRLRVFRKSSFGLMLTEQNRGRPRRIVSVTDFRVYRETLTLYLRDCLVNLTRASGTATGEIRWLFSLKNADFLKINA